MHLKSKVPQRCVKPFNQQVKISRYITACLIEWFVNQSETATVSLTFQFYYIHVPASIPRTQDTKHFFFIHFTQQVQF